MPWRFIPSFNPWRSTANLHITARFSPESYQEGISLFLTSKCRRWLRKEAAHDDGAFGLAEPRSQ
jgi:hypothetical protein